MFLSLRFRSFEEQMRPFDYATGNLSPRPDDHDSFPYKRVQPFIMHVEDVPHGQEAKNKQNIHTLDKIALNKLFH